MNLKSLLLELESRKISLFLQNSELRYKGPKSALDDSLLKAIRKKRVKLVEMLKEQSHVQVDKTRMASPEAIQQHYDAGDMFYAAWLDPTMSYSCAFFEDEHFLKKVDFNDACLKNAQLKKLDYHIAESGIAPGMRILDIGCGWGALLRRIHDIIGSVELVGLTLSNSQFQHIQKLNVKNISVYLENWADHNCNELYDAIICIEAMEAFVRPENTSEERMEIYRKYFGQCHGLLKPGGHLSIQVIVYEVGSFRESAISSIFPESDMPQLSELCDAWSDYFHTVKILNHSQHYVYTLNYWYNKMINQKPLLIEMVGVKVFDDYVRYLSESIWAFRSQQFGLIRLTLKRKSNSLIPIEETGNPI